MQKEKEGKTEPYLYHKFCQELHEQFVLLITSLLHISCDNSIALFSINSCKLGVPTVKLYESKTNNFFIIRFLYCVLWLFNVRSLC